MSSPNYVSFSVVYGEFGEGALKAAYFSLLRSQNYTYGERLPVAEYVNWVAGMNADSRSTLPGWFVSMVRVRARLRPVPWLVGNLRR